MKDFDCRIYFPRNLDKNPRKMQTLLDSDLQSFWKDYSLCDLQGKTTQELKLYIEEQKLKKDWLDLEQERDEPQDV